MRRWGMATLALLALATVAPAQQKKAVVLPKDSVYQLSTKTLEGKDADLKEYAGKVALVVNLASQ